MSVYCLRMVTVQMFRVQLKGECSKGNFHVAISYLCFGMYVDGATPLFSRGAHCFPLSFSLDYCLPRNNRFYGNFSPPIKQKYVYFHFCYVKFCECATDRFLLHFKNNLFFVFPASVQLARRVLHLERANTSLRHDVERETKKRKQIEEEV